MNLNIYINWSINRIQRIITLLSDQYLKYNQELFIILSVGHS